MVFDSGLLEPPRSFLEHQLKYLGGSILIYATYFEMYF